jgi:endonuclease/exonuclease/phosphatase family metal-dependent hydrolase
MRAAIAAVVLTLGLTGPVTGAETPRPLRLVTFNLFHGGASSGLLGDAARLDARLDMVARELAALRPDVVALQEASSGRGRGNVAARLAQRLDLHWVHAEATARVFSLPLVNRVIVWTLNFSEGPAILSRFPIVAHEIHDLPRCERRLDPRVLLHAELETPWGRVSAYSTHASRDDCQLRRIAALVEERRGALPAFVMGDFNAGEHLPGIQTLTNGASGFVDAFRAANPATPGFTVWQRIELPDPTVFRRVDYVFVAPGLASRGRVTDSRLVLNVPGRLADGTVLWPSDHYGVLADIEIVAAPREARPAGGR